MYTNLNAVIRTNPDYSQPKKNAKVNFTSTNFNFINFDVNREGSALSQQRATASAQVTQR